jgi:hypothetical protein
MHAMGMVNFAMPSDEPDIDWKWYNGECQFYGVSDTRMVIDIWGYPPALAKADQAKYGGEYLEMDGEPPHAGLRHTFPIPSTFDEAFDRFVEIGELNPTDKDEILAEYHILPMKAIFGGRRR